MGKSDDDSLKVSILLPTYNRAALLPKCIESVISQTYKNWELIIADDGSSDNTPEEARKLQRLDPKIIYHRSEDNVGLPQNRNISLSLASGDLIWFIEDDMILKNDCLERLVETWNDIKKSDGDLGVLSPALVTERCDQDTRRGVLDFARDLKESDLAKSPCVVDRRTGLIYRNFHPDFKEVIEIEDAHSCSVYRKEVFDQIQYESQAYIGNYIGEESDFHFRLRKMGYTIYFQPQAILYHNTVNSGGCRLPLMKWSYYFIRNHIIFLKRNYGIRSIYMIPYFFIYNLSVVIRYIVWGGHIDARKNLE